MISIVNSIWTMISFEHMALQSQCKPYVHMYRIDWSATGESIASIVEHSLVLSYLLKQSRVLSTRKGKKKFLRENFRRLTWSDGSRILRRHYRSSLLKSLRSRGLGLRGKWRDKCWEKAIPDWSSTIGVAVNPLSLGSVDNRSQWWDLAGGSQSQWRLGLARTYVSREVLSLFSV